MHINNILKEKTSLGCDVVAVLIIVVTEVRTVHTIISN